MSVRLEDLGPCFQGIVPAALATCSADGEPNVTDISQVYYLDPKHVALSCQFFNKTKRNLLENGYARVEVLDPRTFEAYRLLLRFVRSETEGHLFETMAARIQMIASHTGMKGVFRLLSADVFEVLALEPVAGFLVPADPRLAAEPCPEVPGPLTELRGLQLVSDRVARATDLEHLLSETLAALEQVFGFGHSMVLVPDETGSRLVTLGSRGYGEQGVGAEVAVGEGLAGIVAERRRMLRVAGVGSELRYGRAIRRRVAERQGAGTLAPEIPLPGLPDAQAQLGLPLVAGDELVGVLVVESRDPLAFDEWDEAFLQIVASQIALAIDRMLVEDDEPAGAPAGGRALRGGGSAEVPARCERRHEFVYYRNDDVVFADGEYLVRGLPARIFWRILGAHQRDGRAEFTNRELRLDDSLGLPGYRDNLESRLILLRKRLAEKTPHVRMVPVRRGRFALEVESAVEMVERDSA